MTKLSTQPLDHHIGKQLRILRRQKRVSLETVGEIIGVSQQQASRYEHGTNRLSAAQIYRLARALNVPLSWFYLDYSGATGGVTSALCRR